MLTKQYKQIGVLCAGAQAGVIKLVAISTVGQAQVLLNNRFWHREEVAEVCITKAGILFPWWIPPGKKQASLHDVGMEGVDDMCCEDVGEQPIYVNNGYGNSVDSGDGDGWVDATIDLRHCLGIRGTMRHCNKE